MEVTTPKGDPMCGPPPMAGHSHISVTCISCGTQSVLSVPTDQYVAWKNGALIQHAMPGLSCDERELLISGICGSCYDKLFDMEVEEEAT